MTASPVGAFPRNRATSLIRLLFLPAFAVLMLGAGPARAQANNEGFLDRLFNNDPAQPQRPAGPPGGRMAQADPSELGLRIDRLEAQLRQMTGIIEQLQFNNQQLSEQLRRQQEDIEFRFQEMGAKPRATTAPAARPQPPAAPAAPGRRSDVFDPGQTPHAPGAPRPLGTVASASPNPNIAAPAPIAGDETEPLIGAPGGRTPGGPLDLSTLASNAANDPSLAPGQLPPPPPRNPNATGTQLSAVAPPSQTPKDLYDLGYGYVLRKDYALATQTFGQFLRTYPQDRLVAEAHYWMGEALFQQQRYRDAAESFLTVSTKYETAAKAPDSLLRLGQSLAALGEKEAACASLAEVGRKFPRAPVNVKRSAEQELKRVRC